MSDSLPPNGGPDPDDRWDLERVLSGDMVWVPEGMRPVVGTLAALRADPVRADPVGEAAARAAFREIMSAGEGGPHAATRPLYAPRHSRRRPLRLGRWPSKALVGAAAAVVMVGGIALAGTFSGAGRHQGPSERSTGAAASSTPKSGGSHAGANGLEGTGATKEPTARSTPSASASGQSAAGPGPDSGPGALCHQYLAFVMRPGSSADVAAEWDNYRQLSQLAGGSGKIGYYCLGLQPWSMTSDAPRFYGGPGSPPAGESQGSQGSQGSQNSQGSQGSKGSQNWQGSQNSQGSKSSPGENRPAQQAGSGDGQVGNGAGPGNQGQH
ncbi:MAG: hypothetical protein ACRDOI_22215 [Trebonia sp.]